MQTIRSFIFGEPEYQPIPQLDSNDAPNHDRQHPYNNNNSNFKPSSTYSSFDIESPPMSTSQSPSQTTCLQDCSTAMTLTRWERFIGFIVLFVLGWLLSLTTLTQYQTIFIKPVSFSLWYSVGNILALLSNFFLYGPQKQFVLMFSRPHYIFSLFYIITIIATIYSAMIPLKPNVNVLITCVVLQLIGSVMFTLSFLFSGLFGRAVMWLFFNRGTSGEGINDNGAAGG